MSERSRFSLTPKGRGRRALIIGGAAAGVTASGLVLARNVEDAYISSPVNNAEVRGVGHTVTGYATFNGEPPLFVAVNKQGEPFATPQVDVVDFINELPTSPYRQWIRTGVMFDSGLGDYLLLLCRMDQRATQIFRSLVEEDRLYGSIQLRDIKPRYGLILEDYKVVTRVS